MRGVATDLTRPDEPFPPVQGIRVTTVGHNGAIDDTVMDVDDGFIVRQ